MGIGPSVIGVSIIIRTPFSVSHTRISCESNSQQVWGTYDMRLVNNFTDSHCPQKNCPAQAGIPQHASWLNMAEIEIGILSRRCLNRRIDNRDVITHEVAAWEVERNQRQAKIHWFFTTAIVIARDNIAKLYPSIED